jgi:1-acyl-sn-glycerol-3-phosphate acyltransferase
LILFRSILFQVHFFASVCFFALLIAIFAWLPYSKRFVFANLWGKTRKYGVSGAALANAASVKIVPVAHNAGDLWARRGIRKKPGLIRFVVGPPIDASAQSPKETNQLAQDWVEAKMAEISPEAYSGKPVGAGHDMEPNNPRNPA